MKNVGNSSRGRSQGVPKNFRAPMYRAHCAVIFAIAQLSCITLLAVSTRPPAGDLSRCTLYCLGLAGLCPPYLSRFALEFSRPSRASIRSFISIHQVAPHDLDLDLDLNTPWVNMSSYAKFGLDRPSRSAGHRQQTDIQRNISPFSMQIPRTLFWGNV